MHQACRQAWLRWPTKRHYLSRLWSVSLDLKHTEASFSPNSIDSLCLRVIRTPRTRDMAIFVLTTTTTRPITLPPCACARGNYLLSQVGQLTSQVFGMCTSVVVHEYEHTCMCINYINHVWVLYMQVRTAHCELVHIHYVGSIGEIKLKLTTQKQLLSLKYNLSPYYCVAGKPEYQITYMITSQL